MATTLVSISYAQVRAKEKMAFLEDWLATQFEEQVDYSLGWENFWRKITFQQPATRSAVRARLLQDKWSEGSLIKARYEYSKTQYQQILNMCRVSADGFIRLDEVDVELLQ